jgi:hypothetical protein
LRLLLAPGSSLGGARPKASVRDKHGHLVIAKFPRRDDEFNTVVWEAVALGLAKKAGIAVPAGRVEAVANKSVLLLRRFDRDGVRRIPFLSAMSMLGSKDNETRSYLEIVDALRQHGAAPKEDMAVLWRRLVLPAQHLDRSARPSRSGATKPRGMVSPSRKSTAWRQPLNIRIWHWRVRHSHGQGLPCQTSGRTQ